MRKTASRFALGLLCAWASALPVWAQASGGGSIWKGKSGPYNIEWSVANLRVTRAQGGQTVLDATSRAKAEWAKLSRNARGAAIEAQYTYRLLSSVGPYLAIEEGEYCDCGGAHPTESKLFYAIDLDKSSVTSWAPLKLTSIFPAEGVFQALSHDAVVRKALSGAPVKTLSELMNELGDASVKVKDCDFIFPPDLLQNFAIFDVKGDSTLVRLSLPPEAQACRGQIAELGLTLGAPLRNKEWFAAAAQRRDGFLMTEANRLPKPALTTLSFGKKK